MKYLITTYDRNDVTDHANYCEAHQIPCIYALVLGEKCTVFVHCEKLTGPRIQALEAHEAEWLTKRLSRDGVLDENERALLRHLGKMSHDIHHSLIPFIEAAA